MSSRMATHVVSNYALGGFDLRKKLRRGHLAKHMHGKGIWQRKSSRKCCRYLLLYWLGAILGVHLRGNLPIHSRLAIRFTIY